MKIVDMADAILFEFGKFVLGQLGSAAVEEVNLLLGVEDELQRIKSNLSSIQAVLRDAERQQSTSDSIKNWLEKLQDVMYDMDDLLDDITTEVALKEKNRGQWRKKVRKFFSRTNTFVLRWQWAHRIKSLCKKLDLIASERASFVLSTEPVDLSSSGWRETHSSLSKSDLILGRDEDKEAIINSILNCGDCESLSVVPVVGQGGIGKTTLAKLLYNDSRIDENFDNKLWVYVSEEFNMTKVLKKVIGMSLTMEQLALEELRKNVSDALKGKKYFLVLDDFWNKDSNEWKKLRELLDVGAKGSTVVVTTRDSKVASNTQTVDQYKLKELSRETCLEIFKQLAFKDGCKRIQPTFLGLADRIVELSMGLPLLVTSLGNLLCGETDEMEWRRVIQKLEEGHEDILNVLKLSYDQLPSYFKLCFRISSIYGKGTKMSASWALLPLWMALGFIPDDEQGEALGRQCVKELLSKSLFIKEVTWELFGQLPDIYNMFHMHDFVHDLARSMVGEELAIINSGTREVSEKVRYIKLDEDGLPEMQNHERLFIQAKKALFMITTPEHSLGKAFLTTIISKLTFLRVLYLVDCQFEELPRTIGYMKHLKYLSLRKNTRIKQLPNSICNLINLQTLNLQGCTNLQELPADIGRLEKLRILDVTTKQEVLPEGIGNIKGLRTLWLCNCPRLAFLPMSTTQLVNLDTLGIIDCKELDLAHGSWSLQSLNSLRALAIGGLPRLQRLPMGVEDLPFTSLQYLSIIVCHGLMELGDWIKHFSSLRTLFIIDCPNLKGLPHTFCHLDKLEKLAIMGCPKLTERCTPENGDDWHLISKIPYIQVDLNVYTREGGASSFSLADAVRLGWI